MAERDDEWVEVAASGNDEEAGLIAGFLESNGIESVIELPEGSSPFPENLGALRIQQGIRGARAGGQGKRASRAA